MDLPRENLQQILWEPKPLFHAVQHLQLQKIAVQGQAHNMKHDQCLLLRLAGILCDAPKGLREARVGIADSAHHALPFNPSPTPFMHRHGQRHAVEIHRLLMCMSIARAFSVKAILDLHAHETTHTSCAATRMLTLSKYTRFICTSTKSSHQLRQSTLRERPHALDQSCS
jgi:hypothetical protein